MINCYVIADLATIECLEAHIERFPLTVLSGYSFLDAFNPDELLMKSPKILFIDTLMLKKFKPSLVKIGKDCSVVYLADTSDQAYDAFEAIALDYLLKPLTYDAFERSLNKFISFSLLAPPKYPPAEEITRKTESITDSFFIKSDFRGQKEILIKCNDVIFIEAEQNYVVLHTVGKKLICHNTLKEMEENLPNRYFIRVHKSFIINYDKITSVEGNVIILNENEKFKIQIGSTYKKAFFERKIKKLIRKKNFFELASYSKYGLLLILHDYILQSNCIFT